VCIKFFYFLVIVYMCVYVGTCAHLCLHVREMAITALITIVATEREASPLNCLQGVMRKILDWL
jgi:hypothetical protein